MIYGLYLSAAGVVANSYRQDVIANNLANAETVGFKRDLPLFKQRLTEAQQRRASAQPGAWSDPVQERIGGGTFVSPTLVDSSQGELEHTGTPLDVAIEGSGYFAVKGRDGGPTRLTRNGRFTVDREGFVALSDEAGHRVLGRDGQPVRVGTGGPVSVDPDGTIMQGSQAVGRIGLYDVPDRTRLAKQGGTLLAYPDANAIKSVDSGVMHGQTVERANVDPTTELTALMETQRQLEANANMIRYQDQTLDKLVNQVGKIG